MKPVNDLLEQAVMKEKQLQERREQKQSLYQNLMNPDGKILKKREEKALEKNEKILQLYYQKIPPREISK